MKRLLEHYRSKLLQDGSATGRSALIAREEGILAAGDPQAAKLGAALLEATGAAALAIVEPPLPLIPGLLADTDAAVLVPPDIETRTFLHDIPVLRRDQLATDPVSQLARQLGRRKGVLAEGIGLVAVGPLTLEQAYVNVSSLFHALFVKALHDQLRRPAAATSRELLDAVRAWTTPLTSTGLAFAPVDELQTPVAIIAEMERVGHYTVQQRLVDSFFGNISCRLGDTVYISQTAASLDALHGCIDPVPFDDSTTCGITASSELLTHRRIYTSTPARVILHGHPKFAVIMSMQCPHRDCGVDDCWRDCPQVRDCCGTPVVAGEVGAGGLAEKVTPVIATAGAAIVYGHGVFTTGRDGFATAFSQLQRIEQACRDEFFRRCGASG